MDFLHSASLDGEFRFITVMVTADGVLVAALTSQTAYTKRQTLPKHRSGQLLALCSVTSYTAHSLGPEAALKTRL